MSIGVDFHFQIEPLGGGLQRVRLLVNQVLKLVGGFDEFPGRLLPLEILLDRAFASSKLSVLPGLTPVMRIMCHPKSVCTGPTMSPCLPENTASSNGLTIDPSRAKVPRSPPWPAEPGSCEFCLASSANLAGVLRALAASASAFSLAAALSASLASGFDRDQNMARLAFLRLGVLLHVGVVLLLHFLRRRP